MEFIKCIVGLFKWLIGATLLFTAFLLCLLFIPGIFDEIIAAVIAVAVAIANPNPFDCD